MNASCGTARHAGTGGHWPRNARGDRSCRSLLALGAGRGAVNRGRPQLVDANAGIVTVKSPLTGTGSLVEARFRGNAKAEGV